MKLKLFVQLLLDAATAKEGAQAKRDGVHPMLRAHRTSLSSGAKRSGLLESDDMGNGGGEAAPVGGLFFQMLAPESGERVKLRTAIVFCLLPLGSDPAFLFELVQSRIEGSFTDLQHVAGDGFQAETDGPAVHGLKGENLQK